MGWFSDDKKEKAKDLGKTAAAKTAASLAWPVKKIASGAMSKYYQKKGNWNKDECPECGKPINKRGFIHQKCVREAKEKVAKWESSMNINNTNYYNCGVHNKNAYADFQHDQICDNKP